MRRTWTAAALGLALVVAAQPGARGQRADDPASPLTRFLRHDDVPLTSYRAVRRLEAESRGGKMHASLVAWTEFDPVNGFRYGILEEAGSGTIRSRVLRTALETERRAQASGEGSQAALTSENYTFEQDAADGEGLLRVSMHPRRNGPMMLDGAIFLRGDEGDLVRVEGRLVKRPSFWTRRVDIVREYARVAGVRVPIAMRSTAHVLIVGRSTFAMRWDYESVNGVAVGPSPVPVTTTPDR